MSEQTDHLLEQLVEEMREMRGELRTIRKDVALMANEYRETRQMQSPLMGRDLFSDDDVPARARAR